MTKIGRFARQLSRMVLVSAAIAFFTITALFAVNLAVFVRGQDRVRDTLANAISDGSILEARNFGPLSGLSLAFNKEKNVNGIHRHDCLIWTSLIAPVPDLLTQVLRTPRLTAAEQPLDPRAPSNPDCQAVAQVLAGVPGAKPEMVFYDRYILAQRALAHVLLSYFSVQTASSIVKAVAFSAFGLALVLAWREKAFAICVMSALFLLFYGLAHFGGMLYFGPLDATHALVLLVAVYLPFGTVSLRSLVAIGATYGSLVAAFEVLTGGIPLAFALISILTGLSALDQRSFLHRVLLLMFSFAVAFVGCLVLKLAIVSLHGGVNAFAEHFGPLVHRLHGDFVLEADPVLIERLSQYTTDMRIIAMLYLIVTYGYWSLIIGWGSPIFGIILVITGTTSLVIATVYVFRQEQDLDGRLPAALSGCWLAVGVAIAWVMLFWNHSLLHAFFMARLLIIPLLCGAVAVTETLRVRRLR